MKSRFFLLICTLAILCFVNPDISNSKLKKADQKSNSLESKQDSISINIAQGVLKSKLRNDAVNLLTDFMLHYTDFNGLMNLFSTESKQYINIPFFSYHLPDFFSKGAFTKYKPTLLSIYVIENDTIAKVSFNRIDSVGNTNLKAIFNFGLTTINSELKLENMVMVNSDGWIHRKVGTIEYVFPKCHKFSQQNADSMKTFNEKLSKIFNVTSFEIRYFITNNNIELQRLRGIDYLVDLYSLNIRSGLAEPNNGIIYSGNGSEYYPHEMVHLYIREWIGANNYHPWFDEGLATFLGGSRGMSLDWHLKELASYSSMNDLEFTDLLNMQRQVTESTNIEYTIGGLICKLAYEKGGIASVKELFAVGKTDDDFYKGIYNVLGIKRDDLNKYIINELSQYSK